MHDPLRDLGELALATRLRRLGERLLAGVDECYEELGLPFRGRWFGLLQALAREGDRGTVALAGALGLSHTAVAHLVRELEEAGWIVRRADPADARRQAIRLSPAGRRRLRRMEPVWAAMRAATAELAEREAPGLLSHLNALEDSLERQPIADRMLARLGRPPRRRLDVTAYRPAHRRLFAALNLAWLQEHFTPEEKDLRLLADPAGQVLRRGGRILVARWEGRPVGVCALLRHGEGDYELAKMAVDPACRRRGAGRALVRAACREARSLGADRLWLLTHPDLADASRLYRRLGFHAVSRDDTYSKRPSIRMERRLDPKEDLT